MGDHAAAHRDADHVLTSLDQTNVKALMRRGFAAKMLGKYDESVRDFQTLLKTKPANEAEVKKELDEAMKKLVEQQKAKKEAAEKAAKEPKAKIQEVGSNTTPVTPTPEQETPQEEEKLQRQATAAKKTKILDSETVNKAVEITQEKVS